MEKQNLNLTDPKYDHCRLFRKGDKVRIITHRGRIAYDEGLEYEPNDTVFIVEYDELKNGIVSVYEQPECDFDAFDIHFSFLELVTPVEELEPYIVTYDDKFYHIHKHGEEASIAVYSEARHPHAKAAAEAERDRLNDEYRKDREIRNEIIEIDKALNKEILNHADAFLTRKEQK